MPLKKISIYIVLILCIQHSWSQEKPITINGLVKYDSVPLRDINVINKTTNLGTSSNEFGSFRMPVSKGDSIEFSAISWQNRVIVITENHLNTKSITVYLEPGYTELDEVEILQKMRLEFNNITVDERAELDIDDVSSKTPPDMQKYINPNQLTNGISLVSIYKALTKDLRNKRKSANDIQNEIALLKSEMPNTVLKLYGADFFTEWLLINPDEVNQFLDFCQDNGLGNYYKSDEIVVTDFLVKQSKAYLQLKE